jgi:hypothetical protein
VSVGACRTLVMLLAPALLATGLQPRSAATRQRLFPRPRALGGLLVQPRAAREQASGTQEERVRRHEDS